MLTRIALLALACSWLSAQEDPFDLALPVPEPFTRISLGAYDQSFSDGYGRWKGWTLEATRYPANGGPWQFAAVGFDRPEGHGTLFSAGKYFLFGKTSSGFVGLSGGTNTDILPSGRLDLSCRLDIAAGWKADLAGAVSRFSGNDEIRMFQAGPAFLAQTWSASFWGQWLDYQPAGTSDTGWIFNFRLGPSDLGPWANLRLAWGRGILETTASGGGLTSTTPAMGMNLGDNGYGGRFGRGGGGSTTPSPTTPVSSIYLATEAPQERLVSLAGHWPFTGALALQAEATWGERVSTTRFWGGSLQLVVTF
jgi:hypothetical protein